MNTNMVERKSCGIIEPNPRGEGCTIFEPCDEIKIDWNNVSPQFRKEFIKTWKGHYDLEAEVGNNSGINVLSILGQ